MAIFAIVDEDLGGVVENLQLAIFAPVNDEVHAVDVPRCLRRLLGKVDGVSKSTNQY